ncbi:hypothetical protein ACJX0J_012959 [Zea mays]
MGFFSPHHATFFKIVPFAASEYYLSHETSKPVQASFALLSHAIKTREERHVSKLLGIQICHVARLEILFSDIHVWFVIKEQHSHQPHKPLYNATINLDMIVIGENIKERDMTTGMITMLASLVSGELSLLDQEIFYAQFTMCLFKQHTIQLSIYLTRTHIYSGNIYTIVIVQSRALLQSANNKELA